MVYIISFHSVYTFLGTIYTKNGTNCSFCTVDSSNNSRVHILKPYTFNFLRYSKLLRINHSERLCYDGLLWEYGLNIYCDNNQKTRINQLLKLTNPGSFNTEIVTCTHSVFLVCFYTKSCPIRIVCPMEHWVITPLRQIIICYRFSHPL